MPTDDCHRQYRLHLDDMQENCVHGQDLLVWEVTFHDNDDETTTHIKYVVARDCAQAGHQAERYRVENTLPHTMVSVRGLGKLMPSGRR